MAKDNKIRVPRLFGTTQMVVQMNKLEGAEKQAALTTLQDYTINQWLLGNGVICGVSLDVMALSKFIDCTQDRVQVFMRDRLLSSKIWDKDKQEELLMGLMGQQLSWALEDRMDCQAQVNLLRRSQGDGYAPFVSAEVNKALKLKLDSSSSLQSIIKNMSGGGTVNIFQQFNQQNNVKEEGMTYEEALEILQSQTKDEPIDKARIYLEDTYGVEELPEVCATKQLNVDTSKEGLNLIGSELNQIADNYKISISEEGKKEFEEIEQEVEILEKKQYDLCHRDRRLESLGLEEDLLEPEYANY